MTGSVVLATDQGLGYLAKDFFDHGLIHKVLIREHGSRTNHRDWYPRESVVSSIDELLECDTLLFFETPFFEEIITKAKAKGIKTVIMPMYECTYPKHVQLCETVIVPSALDEKYYPQGTFIPVPVDIPWRQRERARHFVHNAGNGGLGGRNGTRELIQAMKFVVSPLKLTIRSQVAIQQPDDTRVTLKIGQFDPSELWNEGDVFVFPEKFNGLSLPLQEAYASGMLVMAGNRFPMNTWLPKEPLIPVEKYVQERNVIKFESAVYNPRDIAAKMDEWYDRDICKLSQSGQTWAQAHGWEALRGRYEDVLSR